MQDLFSGKIEADPNAKPEYIDIRKVSEGILTNLIPQIIKAGEKIGTVILEDGKEEPIIAEEDITIEAGTPVAVKCTQDAESLTNELHYSDKTKE